VVTAVEIVTDQETLEEVEINYNPSIYIKKDDSLNHPFFIDKISIIMIETCKNFKLKCMKINYYMKFNTLFLR